MGNSRQITVLRSLFKTLHPLLDAGLAPARRLLTGNQQQTPDDASTAVESNQQHQPKPKPVASGPHRQASGRGTATGYGATSAAAPALARTHTDEHLVTELENITAEMPRAPRRMRRHYSRDTLMALLEEAKVRIQVLETELEIARGTDEHIPMLTEEWSDGLPSTHARELDELFPRP